VQIAVASGKGGTGKTTIATSLALSLSGKGKVTYLDCDVEAPNGHLFLHPDINQQSQAVVRIPQIVKDRCTLCGKCVEVCQFHTLVKVGTTIMVFPQLCHGCGSCTLNCPEQAIMEIPSPIGLLETGVAAKGIHFGRGLLTISEPMATPVIRQLKHFENFTREDIVILDAPPGASCSVVETFKKSDFVVLVTEPTPFGLHDLKQAQGIVSEMKIPAGVIINRENGNYSALTNFCADTHLPVLMRIPFERRIAEGLAQGLPLIDIYPEYRYHLQQMYDHIISIVNEKPDRDSAPNVQN